MGSAYALTTAEIRLIKAMLELDRPPSNQATPPISAGRDINHRVISEIKHKTRWADVSAASSGEARAYMRAARRTRGGGRSDRACFRPAPS
jgi:hypothetical protein